jgi:hypothetical protein
MSNNTFEVLAEGSEEGELLGMDVSKKKKHSSTMGKNTNHLTDLFCIVFFF